MILTGIGRSTNCLALVKAFYRLQMKVWRVLLHESADHAAMDATFLVRCHRRKPVRSVPVDPNYAAELQESDDEGVVINTASVVGKVAGRAGAVPTPSEQGLIDIIVLDRSCSARFERMGHSSSCRSAPSPRSVAT